MLSRRANERVRDPSAAQPSFSAELGTGSACRRGAVTFALITEASSFHLNAWFPALPQITPNPGHVLGPKYKDGRVIRERRSRALVSPKTAPCFQAADRRVGPFASLPSLTHFG